MKTPTTDITQLSAKELETLLKQKKAAEAQAAATKRNEYEAQRNQLINSLAQQAVKTNAQIKNIKADAFKQLKDFKNTLLLHGSIKNGENNKGSFKIENEQFRIEFTAQVKKAFDERSKLAETKLKEYLSSTVKKSNKQHYKLIMSLLERNSITGDLDIDNINRLYKMEEEINHPLFSESMQLFRESYNPTKTTEYVRFYQKNERNAWQLIDLNFSSI